ncbi:30S ribosome-binding factor RbfA [Alicyclobacillus mali]|uniref:Ribosome-binding factor A n=1 Tax=Alicyclobacillus mali (ex Roth et al. 2021) TaxID=1123961 RepID=A0ABS0F1P2_9BACL|nr:30S ribosome-binding factor RbfA [Alicyclobacillus mali (ex Roth et al. 2021)]MBF8377198.1 30S ribosome-binding factor RbfA [Alicyclobacillus mali (ex Roth et al. 2021)]MCL6488769.1 30S ribosome-binding factor RbfA [Alicyclobacillus mali (ex Roth et al. 2021)]
MTRIRAQKVAEQMKKELADLLQHELKDPRLGFVTITRVDVSGDLQHAKVYVSVYGAEEAKETSLGVLSKAAGFLRGEIARRLHMRMAPELVFRLDESGEYSERIEQVLKSLNEHDAND